MISKILARQLKKIVARGKVGVGDSWGRALASDSYAHKFMFLFPAAGYNSIATTGYNSIATTDYNLITTTDYNSIVILYYNSITTTDHNPI